MSLAQAQNLIDTYDCPKPLDTTHFPSGRNSIRPSSCNRVNLTLTPRATSNSTALSESAMAETQRSFLRDSHGPRAVDAGSCRSDKGRGSGRRHKDSDDKDKHRSKRESSQRSPKKDSSHRRKHSSTSTSESCADRPQFELDVIGQPPRGVALGLTVECSAFCYRL